jgi:hypothetical protein
MWFRIWGKFGIDHAGSLCLDQGFLTLLFHGPLWSSGETYGLPTPQKNALNWSVAICFFRLSLYLTENTICLSYACRQTFLRPQLEPHRERRLFQLCICRHLSSASVRTSQRTPSVSVMHLSSDVSSASVRTSHKTRSVSVMHLSSAVSSAAAPTSQRTPRVSALYQSSVVTWALARTLQGQSLSLLWNNPVTK